jgi:F0F1-type ATP synthase gamma subunit
MNKREKVNENGIKKIITGNKMDMFINRRKANIINPHTKLSSRAEF